MKVMSRVAALAVASLVVAAPVSAQDYPNRAVKIIVPFGPGGPADVFARQLAQHLGDDLKQSFVVENRPGAGSIIGTDAVAKSPADGYTLLMGSNSTLSVGPSLNSKVNYHPVRDFAPVSLLTTHPLLLLAHPSVPVRTVKELVALAKASPEKLNAAIAGSGTPMHMGLAQFNSMVGVRIPGVIYKGAGPAMQELLAGRIPAMILDVSTGLPHLKSGRLRAVGIAAPARNAASVWRNVASDWSIVAWAISTRRSVSATS